MKPRSFFLFVVLTLSGIGCNQTTLKSETTQPHQLNKWQPILLKSGEYFQYQAKIPGKNLSSISLSIRQDSPDKLHALWEVRQEDKIMLLKQLIASPESLLISSKAALLTEKIALPFIDTILMNWWSEIDYFRWEVGFKRAVQVEMLAIFMVEVINECHVAGIKGFQVQLKAGKSLMAEACLSPTITLPLSVKRYRSNGEKLKYEVTLLNYRHR